MSTKGQAFAYEESEEISDGLWFCAKFKLYWKDGTVYDERSAAHNGLIGHGAELKQLIKEKPTSKQMIWHGEDKEDL